METLFGIYDEASRNEVLELLREIVEFFVMEGELPAFDFLKQDWNFRRLEWSKATCHQIYNHSNGPHVTLQAV